MYIFTALKMVDKMRVDWKFSLMFHYKVVSFFIYFENDLLQPTNNHHKIAILQLCFKSL